MKNIPILLVLILSFASCVKTPGDGGKASIIGKVELIRRVQINNPASTVDTISAPDLSVYIIYGDHISPDDKVDTNPDGDFAFEWLRTGDYTIYVYSEDTTSTAAPLPKVAFEFDVSIMDKSDVIDMNTLYIYDKN
ncbi:MAG: hypothetical protein COA49_02640 [Bacteroidetes bacterium]|nr:MAG: hypothetical protein COA49_03685 [Bacteroidota bacterium]PCJ81879.1 MAG: hypothetical protein COA49_02640 [Bacteroidota bacterium]